MTSLKKMFTYIALMSKKYNIDESHGVKHSMDVVQFAHNIYMSEIIKQQQLQELKQLQEIKQLQELKQLQKKELKQLQKELKQLQPQLQPQLQEQEKVIYSAALLHDMCDKKYMDENEGIQQLESFIGESFSLEELNATKDIITTMSYSKVMKTGVPVFPNLGKWQFAYHIVREADLLAAYDFDRCMIYQMEKLNGNFDTALEDAKMLFDKRVLNHFKHNLFQTEKGKELGQTLHINALNRIRNWNFLAGKHII